MVLLALLHKAVLLGILRMLLGILQFLTALLVVCKVASVVVFMVVTEDMVLLDVVVIEEDVAVGLDMDNNIFLLLILITHTICKVPSIVITHPIVIITHPLIGSLLPTHGPHLLVLTPQLQSSVFLNPNQQIPKMEFSAHVLVLILPPDMILN